MLVQARVIGLIGAMDEEIQLILDKMTEFETSQKAGIPFYRGQFAGRQVVLCKCGVGKVNAAVCTQLLIDDYAVDAIIFTGVAGALDPALDIGDVVISTACMHHDMDATALGYRRGEIPFQSISEFPADPSLIESALEASRQIRSGKVITGLILSGDQFIADQEQVKQLYRDLDGTCTEMEGAAVAQVCHMNKVPYVVIRSISDRADGSAHMNFAEFTTMAAQQSYQIVEAMLRS